MSEPLPERAVRDRRARVRAAAAADPRVPADVVRVLAGDPSPVVRRALAGRREDLPDVFALLAWDADAQTREAVAGNPFCPPGVLASLVDDPVDLVRWEIPRADLDAAVVSAIVGSPDVTLRRLMAETANPEAQRRLAADDSAAVRGGAALTTRDEPLLARLVGDPSAEVRSRAAQNPHLVPAQRHALANDRSASVRRSLIQAGGVDPDDFDALAGDRSADVRWWLAAVPESPAHILRRLTTDADDEVAGQARAMLRGGGRR